MIQIGPLRFVSMENEKGTAGERKRYRGRTKKVPRTLKRLADLKTSRGGEGAKLWTPLVLEMTPIAEKIRASRSAFLSNHVFKTYSGYVLSQFRRMKNSFESRGKYKTKHAMHLIRLLHSGIGALQTGDIMIDVSQHRTQLMDIRNGKLEFEEVRQLALALDKDFQNAFETTKLPEQPDFESVNQLLIEARNSMVDK